MASAAAGLGISPASAGIRVTVSPMPGSRSCQGTPPPAGRRPGRRVTAPHGSGHGGLDPLDPARPRLARGAVVDGDPGLGALFLHGLEGLACRVGRVQFRCFLARPGVAGRHGFAREPGKGCGKALQPLHPDDGEQGLAAGIHKFQPRIDLATRHRCRAARRIDPRIGARTAEMQAAFGFGLGRADALMRDALSATNDHQPPLMRVRALTIRDQSHGIEGRRRPRRRLS